MSPDQAKKLIEMMKSKPTHDGGEWVKAPCPLARWTHQHGHDTNPSFGIKVKEGERSHYHCFSCQSGSLSELVGALTMHLQKTPDLMALYPLKQIMQMVEDEELAVMPLPEYSEFTPSAYAEFQEWPKYFIESFVSWKYSKDAVEYLKKRGVTHEQAEKHDIRWDANKRMVVFPYRNVYGKLAGARGRAVDDWVKNKHFDYTWNQVNNALLTWYNEEVLNNEEPIIVVEGQFDCLAVERVYPNVIANLTAKPSAFKMKRLQQAVGVIPMLDNDKTGDTALQKYIQYFDQHEISCCPIILPKDYNEDGTLIKLDPDKLGSEWIRQQLLEIGLIS